MAVRGSIEAQLLWWLLDSGTSGVLEEAAADYCGMLERMGVAELLSVVEKAKERLKTLGLSADVAETMPESMAADLVDLFIDRQYRIRTSVPDGPVLPLRPLVKTIFILFLRHPEGILFKQRGRYRQELEEIYAVICPNIAMDDIRERVGRLVNLEDNSFSEKVSVLNARLDELLSKGTAKHYQIQGNNGHPRRIPLNPLLVHWT